MWNADGDPKMKYFWVCLCVWKAQRERERKNGKFMNLSVCGARMEKEHKNGSFCVCLSVCLYGTHRESPPSKNGNFMGHCVFGINRER